MIANEHKQFSNCIALSKSLSQKKLALKHIILWTCLWDDWLGGGPTSIVYPQLMLGAHQERVLETAEEQLQTGRHLVDLVHPLL